MTNQLEHAPLNKNAIFVYSDRQSTHSLGDFHPMQPVRHRQTFELLKESGIFDAPNVSILEPRLASQEELLRFHDREYIDAIQASGTASTLSDFGLGIGDNPVYPGLYEANSLSTGGTLVAAEAVISGSSSAAFSVAGGLHHALPSRASGFCVFNDPVIAIIGLLERGLRVAYVDIDCHHGDGVQLAFYNNDRVLTVSIHESGDFLFPGTGSTDEIGIGDGEGFSVNIPLAPYTTDSVYLETFDALVPQIVSAFAPDVLFTQHGIDTHFSDPITHMNLTTQGFQSIVERLGTLSDDINCKWIGTGGGGYGLSAVARGWSMGFSIMAQHTLPATIPSGFTALPDMTTFEDSGPPPVRADIQAKTRSYANRSVDKLSKTILPRFGIT